MKIRDLTYLNYTPEVSKPDMRGEYNIYSFCGTFDMFFYHHNKGVKKLNTFFRKYNIK